MPDQTTAQQESQEIEPRHGMPSPKLARDEFLRRYLQQFADPAFDQVRGQIDEAAGIAWEAYQAGRKAPLTRKAGSRIPRSGLQAFARLAERARRHPLRNSAMTTRRGAAHPADQRSPRSEHTCPGEMSKSWRLVQIARQAIEDAAPFEIDVLDLSRVTSEYGRNIHPCKACFSTAAPLCHWPCSCYPNHSLGQTQDWMNDIYPMWVAAHGVMIVTPVHWYQVTSPLKLMIDRLVCADGGNPDPTRTHGKDAKRAKQIELEGWDYPRHLEGRMFSVVVHGDVEGAENVRRSISDWLCFMHMAPAGSKAELDRYIGYWKPYATSHNELDHDAAVQQEVANAAITLVDAVMANPPGGFSPPSSDLPDPRAEIKYLHDALLSRLG